MTKTNTAENLAVNAEMTDAQKEEAAKTIVAEATKKTAPQSAMKLFTSSVLSSVAKQVLTAVPLTDAEIKVEKEKGSDATVKMVPIRRKLTDAEMVELGETEAEEFRKIGEGEDELLKSSADRYAVWGPIFPIRLGTNGKPDIAEFVNRIWDGAIPDKVKTPKAGVAGAFMTCTSAARERNQVAKGIVSMSRWISRNQPALFAHLGVTVSADEKQAAALKKVESAIETLAGYISEVEKDETRKEFFRPCDEEGNPVVDDAGNPVIVDIRAILTAVRTQLVAPELKSKVEAVDHLKKEREEARKKEEKENLTPEEKKDAEYHGEGVNEGYKGN